jgi:hypothetical protein
MKSIKTLVYSVFIGFILANSPVYAAPEDVGVIKAAINDTVAKVEEAIAALEKGEQANKVSEIIVEARQFQKSISTSDSKVSMLRSKSNHKLVEARNSIINGDAKTGGDLLKEALAGYQEVKVKFNASH